MPTRQTIKTATDLIPPPPQQQQQHVVLSNNNNNIHSREAELETHERMKKMPSALRDVDELVNEIKLNLRLKTTSDVSGGGGGAKVRTTRKLARIQSAPYYVKASCTQSCATKDEEGEVHLKTCQTCQFNLRQRRQRSQTTTTSPDDPYQLLQELLKEGGLIKEAVRRLNYIGDETKCFDYDRDDYEPSSSAVQVILPPV